MVTNWKRVKEFFNSKTSNKIFTRAEVLDFRKKMTIKTRRRFSQAYLETCRLYLVRAGYLKSIEPGVYRKKKKIPKELTLTQLKKEAYPKSARTRTRSRRISSLYVRDLDLT